jgi:hypothetical protein
MADVIRTQKRKIMHILKLPFPQKIFLITHEYSNFVLGQVLGQCTSLGESEQHELATLQDSLYALTEDIQEAIFSSSETGESGSQSGKSGAREGRSKRKASTGATTQPTSQAKETSPPTPSTDKQISK